PPLHRAETFGPLLSALEELHPQHRRTDSGPFGEESVGLPAKLSDFDEQVRQVRGDFLKVLRLAAQFELQQMTQAVFRLAQAGERRVQLDVTPCGGGPFRFASAVNAVRMKLSRPGKKVCLKQSGIKP